MTVVLACDLGGTQFRAAAVDAGGIILARDEQPTPRGDRDRVIDFIAGMLRDIGTGQEPARVAGVAIAGLTNGEEGRYIAGPNIPGLRNAPLAKLLSQRLSVPVAIENDASAAALAEHRFGAGRGTRHLLHATLGTGIGGGIVVDGRLYRGGRGFAGEIGHTVVDLAGPQCVCGANGCVEAFVSGTAFTRRGKRLLANNRAPRLAELTAGREPQARDLFAAAQAGDQACEAEIRHAGHVLGIGLASALTLLNPDRLTLSGGLLAMGDMLLEPMRDAIRAKHYSGASTTEIRHTVLDDDSGLLGAAAVALAMLDDAG